MKIENNKIRDSPFRRNWQYLQCVKSQKIEGEEEII